MMKSTPVDRACEAAFAACNVYKKILPFDPITLGRPRQHPEHYKNLPSSCHISSQTLTLPPPPCRRNLLPRLVSPESNPSGGSSSWQTLTLQHPPPESLSNLPSPFSSLNSQPFKTKPWSANHYSFQHTAQPTSRPAQPVLTSPSRHATAVSHGRSPSSNYPTFRNDSHSATTPRLLLVSRPSLGVADIDKPTFSKWLEYRKTLWRNQRHAKRTVVLMKQRHHPHIVRPHTVRNTLFRDAEGVALAYDNDQDDAKLLFDPDEGTRYMLFLKPPNEGGSFGTWLAHRKTTWRKKWKVRVLTTNNQTSKKPFASSSSCTGDDDDDHDDCSPRTVPVNFWTIQSYQSFDHWLAASTEKWKLTYSWNQNKRKRLEMESEEIVHYPSSHMTSSCNPFESYFLPWLQVRKNQWRIQRRKRQRISREASGQLRTLSPQVQNASCTNGYNECKECGDRDGSIGTDADSFGSPVRGSSESPRLKQIPAIREMVYIDALLDEMERRQKELDQRPPLDIAFFFDASKGVPDDVVAHCLGFLPPLEHGKLICIDTTTRKALKDREDMWRHLCPRHWTLPRRPRKPWHELYLSMLRMEEEKSRKGSDDLLMNASNQMFKGDHLQKIESMISRAEKDFGFNINYTSGVVCERNGLLNSAVVYGRHKIARWLIEAKHADIETSDRGHFTPLLNAAWSGDKFLVRFLLSKGADRSKIGTGHYSEALAPVDFKGLTAEGWARKKGHNEIAHLLATGL